MKNVLKSTVIGLFLVMAAAFPVTAADYNGHFGDMDSDGDRMVSWEEFQAYFPHAEEKVFSEIAEGEAFDHDQWHDFKEKHDYGHIEGKHGG